MTSTHVGALLTAGSAASQSVSRGDLAAVTELAPVALAGFDHQLTCTGANPRFAQLAGVAERHTVGRSWSALLPQLGDDARHSVEEIACGGRDGVTLQVERERIWRLHLYAVQAHGAVPRQGGGRRSASRTGRFGVGLVGEDVTADLERLGELARQARVDGLTGVLNRTAFHTAAREAATAARRTRPAGLVVIDLDGFKAVNDTFGHATGDEVLAEVGARLRAVLAPGDVAGRIGGDEFAVLSRCSGRRRLTALVGRLHQVLDAPVALGATGRVRVTATTGEALMDGDTTAAQALAAADAELYARKRQGRLRPALLDDGASPVELRGDVEPVDPVLDRACGLIMGRHGCGERQALAVLARIARTTRRTLTEVAADLDADANRPAWQRLLPRELA